MMEIFQKMRYRLAIDLGPSSLGWALIRLNNATPPAPVALIRTGVRIFSDGRHPEKKTSLAGIRREARAMRRQRDRRLKRKARLLRLLISHGFFPYDENERQQLVSLNPYQLRAQGLDKALSPPEFARALFHINQHRGFKSNRKTDKNSNDTTPLKAAITAVQQQLDNGQVRTVGEWLYRRHQHGETVRARPRGKSYDLYIDRSMIAAEFDALWAKQAQFNPQIYTEAARTDLRDCLLFQRSLRPVQAGRCTLLTDQPRAPLALPSQQRFRIYQELSNLRILQPDSRPQVLSPEQRDLIAKALEKNSRRTFTQIRKLLKLDSAHSFNLEDIKRKELKGNATSVQLAKKDYFGNDWFDWELQKQDEIVRQLLNEESENELVCWLQRNTGIDKERARTIANARLAEGFGSLSAMALEKILPHLGAQDEIVSYAEAANRAGFHHSALQKQTKALQELPYYGEYLQRHVGFVDGNKITTNATPEQRFGRIANPSVHIGLNQIRVVVNALLKRYGHPHEIIVEVANELKQNHEMRQHENRRQAENQQRNQRHSKTIAKVLGVDASQVKTPDLHKMILWEELSPNPVERCCPYSGEQISISMLLSHKVEIDHILPFSRTLDDSLNNKTVVIWSANRIKGDRTPWEARQLFANKYGGDFNDILQRTAHMTRTKSMRFHEDGYANWLGEHPGFIARALNDTRYLSRVACEYLSLICPKNTRVIPGRMTSLLRHTLGLNSILGRNNKKNREDHRHHAIDACVIGITDQGLLQRFAVASEQTGEAGLQRLIKNFPAPWPSYRKQVQHAIEHTWVSHRPDHSHEGAMHDKTAYGLCDDGWVRYHKTEQGQRRLERKKLEVIKQYANIARHGTLPDGTPKPYKGYKGNSNYCLEIVRDPHKGWQYQVISTYDAYLHTHDCRSSSEATNRLRNPRTGLDGRPLVMRLMRNDLLRLEIDGELKTMRITSIKSTGQIFMAPHHEANVNKRNLNPNDPFKYVSKTAAALYKARGRLVTVSPIGELKDPGFAG